MSALTFPNILLSGQATNDGRLELSADAATWVSRAGDRRTVVDLRRVESAEWVDAGRACQLWLRDADGELTRYEGFKVADQERVAAALAASPVAGTAAGHAAGELALRKLKPSVKGRNWGTWAVVGKTLEWREEGAAGGSSSSSSSSSSSGGGGALIAALPLSAVSQAAATGKGEVQIQFMDEDNVEKEDEVLVEMRLYVPAAHELPDAAVASAAARRRAADQATRRGVTLEGEEQGEEAEAAAKREIVERAGADAALQLQALISEAAGVAGVAGDAILEFGEDVGQFLTPRGRFVIEMYPTFARLVGKTAEYKVAYKSISRMFYLPRPSPTGDEVSKYFFVISLDDPLRAGAQRHAHLVMHLDKKPLRVELNVSDEDIRAERYGGLGKDASTVEGELPRTFAALFKAISGKPIYKPGDFKSAHGAPSIKAAVRSADGVLYLLEKSILFLHKPAIWLRYEDVEHATCRRSTGASRSWELALTVRRGTALAAGAASAPKGGAGAGGAVEVAFQAIDAAELGPVKMFLEKHDVAVEEEAHGGGALASSGGGGGGGGDEGDEGEEDEDEEEDEDYDGEGAAAAEASSSAAAAGKRKRKTRGAAAAGIKKRRAGADEGAGDNDDEDAGELPSDEGSYAGESGADSDEDAGSGGSGGGGSSSGSGGGSDDDDDDDGFRKKKKKAAKKAPKKAAPKAKGAASAKKAPPKKKPVKKAAKKRRSEDEDEDGDD